ncbi:MAG: hypothetical protein QM601_08505 [Pseudoxanthomonas sp.]
MLYLIYGKDGDGAVSYEIGDGSWVNWWYGYPFEFKGAHWYAGFSWMSPEKFGEDADRPDTPATTVAIGQATFRQAAPGAAKPWTQVDTDGYVGEFGAYGKAAEVDGKREPLRFDTADGRMLLAVPTRSFGRGVTSLGYALFVFDPDRVAPLRNGRWAYVGSLAAGEHNAEACDGGRVMPCTSSTGALDFRSAADGGLPTIAVKLSGDTIDRPGGTRRLGEQDTVHYRFDGRQSAYAR